MFDTSVSIACVLRNHKSFESVAFLSEPGEPLMETDSNYVPRVNVLSLIMSSQRRMRSSRNDKHAGG